MKKKQGQYQAVPPVTILCQRHTHLESALMSSAPAAAVASSLIALLLLLLSWLHRCL
jgi:hypothetical protein